MKRLHGTVFRTKKQGKYVTDSSARNVPRAVQGLHKLNVIITYPINQSTVSRRYSGNLSSLLISMRTPFKVRTTRRRLSPPPMWDRTVSSDGHLAARGTIPKTFLDEQKTCSQTTAIIASRTAASSSQKCFDDRDDNGHSNETKTNRNRITKNKKNNKKK